MKMFDKIAFISDGNRFEEAQAIGFRARIPLQNDRATLDRAEAVADLERAYDVLLHQQDRDAVAAQLGDQGEDFIHDHGARPSVGSSTSSRRGVPTSTRAMASI